MMTKIINSINTNKKIRDRIATEILLVLFSVISFWAIQNLNQMSILKSLKYTFLNFVVIYVIFKLVYLLIGNLAVSVGICEFALYCFAVANHYVGQFRGIMILPWDFLAGKTALDVAGTYSYDLYPAQFFWLFAIVISVIICIFFKNGSYHKKTRAIYSLISVVVCAFLMFIMISSTLFQNIPGRLYNIERYYRSQGIPVSFFKYCKYLYTPKPDNYSIDYCNSITEKYTAENNNEKQDNSASRIVPSNVIVVMNESFTDFSSYPGSDIPEINDALDFYNSLTENTVRGNLYVPVFGGTTVNTEYEFLTGNSIAFQKGCPFSYAVRSDRPSIARIFESNGYEVHGMHPATAENWGRKLVYPYLGLEDFISIEDFGEDDVALINEHPTDSWDYSEVIKLYENKKSDKFFLFNVTMQNHGGYTFDIEEEKYGTKTDLSAYGDFPQAENYLSLLSMSDDAFKELIDYFSKVDEPTMICMFGDHQPKIEDDFYTMLNGEQLDESIVSENLKKYATTFVIWTNYDTDEANIGDMSSNYLPELLMETANMELNSYYQLLKELRTEYPVFSSNGIKTTDGQYLNVEDVMSDETINYYNSLEYNNANEKDDKILWDAFIGN